MKKMYVVFFLCLLLNPWANSWAAGSKNENAAHAIDQMIDHQMEALDISKENKNKSADNEFMKLFDDLIAQQEKDLKRLQDTRAKLFPNVEKKPSIKDKATAFSQSIDENIRKLEADMKTAFNNFNTKLHEGRDIANTPRVEIKEDSSSYEILAEVPGMARDEIQVKLTGNDLLIKGSRKSELKKRGPASTSSEFKYGEYERLVHLENKVDPKSMKTEYKDGIITIRVNKL